ncbi:MAG: ABC transporter ATP-binding protein [Bdellovibrionales bacterium]
MVRTAWHHAGELRHRMVWIYILFFLANVIVAFQPVVLAEIINVAQRGGPEAMHDALWWSGAYAGLSLGFWLLHGPARVIERRLAFVIFSNFTQSLYRKVTEMPFRWHQDHHSGDTINRVNKAGRGLYHFSGGQFVIIQSCVRLVISLGMLFFYSWWVALTAMTVSLAVFLIIRRFDKVLIPLVRKTNEREHHLNAALFDYIGNIVTVLTLRLQGSTAVEIENRFAAMKIPLWRETLVNEGKWWAANFLLVFSQGAIVGAYVAAHLWTNEALALGSVVAIFQYLHMISQLFFSGMITYEELMYRHIDTRGVDGLLADHAKLAGTQALQSGSVWRDIRIENLTFTHQEGEEALHTLSHVNLGIKAGQKIALIGESGSGKTTLLTLMRGLYQAQQVQLAIDGRTHDSLAPLASFTTLIPQDSEIFENTIFYNLTLGTDVPDKVVKQALAITTFDDVVAKLPQGIWTDIRERGINLSGGQKQRLALARGLIAARDVSLLLLDEPTSSVDLATESVIFDRMFAAFADKAVIASIHRLHLLPRFDYIGFMQDGAMVEQGMFPELLAKRGAFYALWQQHLAQTGGKNEA